MLRITDMDQPSSPDGKEVLTPVSRTAWRGWLAGHPERKEGVWVVYRKKSSRLEGPLYPELVEEALCFGWIDSKTRRVDDDRTIQWFSPRRKGGVWSALNKQRIERLTAQGLMTEAGQAAIDAAKADGSWSQLDEIDALVVPADLAAAFGAEPRARAAFESLPDSGKKQHLFWIHSAKQTTTRTNRISQLVQQLVAGR